MDYILQSHNSWSYLKPKNWWLRPFAFIAKCQNASIYEQYYNHNVRAFDLRVRFDDEGRLIVAHGKFQYNISYWELIEHLSFLNQCECVVRLMHEVRSKNQHTRESVSRFREFCSAMEVKFPQIKFYGGKNLYNWKVDYKFNYEPLEEEIHASVKKPKIIDDWFPLMFAKLNNKKIIKNGTDKDILTIDFVDVQ